MFNRNKKKSGLLDTLLPKHEKKHTRLKRGLIGAGLLTVLAAAFTKKNTP